ncbi:MAG: DNA polymerase III subunit gamma/tau [Brevinemataceae bacterium]
MLNYQVTARKWRPQDFDQVIGQDHVTAALANAVNSGKIPHAYLFSGPRGVGKTSTARILAKMLNCVESPKICGVCPACIEISSGQSLDVREIDGASNRGIEQIRDIRDNAVYAPLSLKYKVFIIDEVHMLTKEASNALLKILEEPPSHIIFMLATTEPNKILPTIRSRCQHYLLKRISVSDVSDQLRKILKVENIPYEDAALEQIARAGEGSMRDAQTILDQAVLYSQGQLTYESVCKILGIPEESYFENITQALIDQDIVRVLEILETYLLQSGDGVSFSENFIRYLRKALLVKKLPFGHFLLDVSEEKYTDMSQKFSQVSEQELLVLINLLLDLSDKLRKESAERFWIESTLFKMLDFRNRISLSDLRQEILAVLGRNLTKVPVSLSVSEQHREKTSVNSSATEALNTSEKRTGNFGAMFQDYQNNQQLPVNSVSEDNPSVLSVSNSSSKTENNKEIKEIENNTIKVNNKKDIQNNDISDVIQNLFETQ